MTQNEKDLLLKDLCARLPYNVAIDCRNEDSRFTCYLTTDILREIQNNTCYWEYKPYLFPISSMTEEQKEEFNSYFASVPYYGDNEHEHVVPYYFVELLIEFFHKNHIDNNGLIPMGLAIDATGKNIY